MSSVGLTVTVKVEVSVDEGGKHPTGGRAYVPNGRGRNWAAGTGTGPLCAHCRRLNGLKPGGLCGSCYAVPELRAEYPSPYAGEEGRKLARHAPSIKAGNPSEPPLPEAPTDAVPGSHFKIEVMAGRLRRGEALFHPLDPNCFAEGDSR